ncbi:hypothetical protein H6P81_019577 [Aristolochia fimbriata]|uniref:TmcB/TmcC TPR repeats domain-containing protein n=1 Tax=Aristolochia fimbriata TaxID=158543 RepID=A0AAV7DVA5_ARIFI|nr:hypothetical protein H6P81_019577 [Aristolochia fimbriata]
MMLRSSSSPVLASMNEAVRVPNLPRTPCNNAFNPLPPLSQTALPRKTHLTRAISSDYLNLMFPPLISSQADSPVMFRDLRPLSDPPRPSPLPATKDPEDVDAEDLDFTFSVPTFSEVDIVEGKEVAVLGLFDLWNGTETGDSGPTKHPATATMYIGLGTTDRIPTTRRSEGTENQKLERHYEKIVEENPYNALVLRNYAQFLHKRKGDYRKAEEFYSRAILADPSDGEILSDYAILRWEEHRDDEMTKGFFERALELSPRNSHILAAYALFMWEANGRNI